MKPLAIDLFCGLGGWTEALLAEGYYVVGFDVERHEYGEHRYPGQLVIQDVLTLHGSQFKDAVLIVENVRGAIPWVGRSRWNFGSFHLWGDVPALMPSAFRGHKVPNFRFDGSGKSFQSASVRRTAVGNGARFTSRDCGAEVAEGRKGAGGSWFNIGSPSQKVTGKNPVHELSGVKCGGDWFNSDQPSISRKTSSKSPARKAASALIAKIPAPLARHIARAFHPARAAA